MKFSSILMAVALIPFAAPAQAQRLDLDAMTCKEFQASDKQTAAMVLMWLEAFYTEANARPVVDFDKMKSDGEKIAAYCAKNPSHVVIIAADNVLEKK
ncbi:MAG TPA: HdeA/HdeB family chaperone [Pseudolabrys sp.]|nr:HdeA/HdeB family chaperone [Pseudolabrys sp.]